MNIFYIVCLLSTMHRNYDLSIKAECKTSPWQSAQAMGQGHLISWLPRTRVKLQELEVLTTLCSTSQSLGLWSSHTWLESPPNWILFSKEAFCLLTDARSIHFGDRASESELAFWCEDVETKTVSLLCCSIYFLTSGSLQNACADSQYFPAKRALNLFSYLPHYMDDKI